MTGTGAPSFHLIQTGTTRIEPAEAAPRIPPPGTVVHPLRHRLADLAVAGDIHAQIPLTAYDVRYGRSQPLRKGILINRPARCLGPSLDQLVRTRQAPGMAGEDMIVAGSHGFPPVRKIVAAGRTAHAVCRAITSDGRPDTVYNWRRLNDRITTSGQPTEPQLADIHALGVRRIVNLGLQTHEKALPDEAASVSRLGMTYIHIPVDFQNPTDRVLGLPSPSMIAIGR